MTKENERLRKLVNEACDSWQRFMERDAHPAWEIDRINDVRRKAAVP